MNKRRLDVTCRSAPERLPSGRQCSLNEVTNTIPATYQYVTHSDGANDTEITKCDKFMILNYLKGYLNKRERERERERVFIRHNGSLPERHNGHQCWRPNIELQVQ